MSGNGSADGSRYCYSPRLYFLEVLLNSCGNRVVIAAWTGQCFKRIKIVVQMQDHHKTSAGKRILCTLVSCVCFRGFPVSVVGMHFQLDPDTVGVCQYALGPCRRVVELCLSSEWSIRDTVRLTLKFFFRVCHGVLPGHSTPDPRVNCFAVNLPACAIFLWDA